jgi:hypothetical protein
MKAAIRALNVVNAATPAGRQLVPEALDVEGASEPPV